MSYSAKNKQLLFSVFLLFVCYLLSADGGFVGEGSDTFSVDQRILFIKNESTLYMTCTTGYTGEGEDFFWVIPTPLTPGPDDIWELGEPAEAVFTMLEDITIPRYFLRNRRIALDGFPAAADRKLNREGETVPLRSENYDITLLNGKGEISPAEWFEEKGFPLDGKTEIILNNYIGNDWTLVVAEIKPAEQRHYENEFLPPLTMKLPGDEIRLPLGISSISTSAEGISTTYIIGDHTVSLEESVKLLYWDRFRNPERFRQHIDKRIASILKKHNPASLLTYKNSLYFDDLGPGAVMPDIPFLEPDVTMKRHIYLSRYDTFLNQSVSPGDIQFFPDTLLSEFEITGKSMTDFSELRQDEQEMLFFIIFIIILLACPVLVILGVAKVVIWMKRSKEPLSRQYDDLYESFIMNLLSRENIAESHSHKEHELSISLIIRPPLNLLEKIYMFQEKMQEIDPHQYFYPPSDIHLSVLSLILPRKSYEPQYLSSAHLPENYDEIIRKSLRDIHPFTIHFRGVSAGPRYLFLKGYPEDKSLRIFRDNLKKRFKRTRLKNLIDRKLGVGTAKIVFMRVLRNMEDPEKILSLMETYEEFDFGSVEVEAIDLVQHDQFFTEKNCRVLTRYELKED